MTRAAVPWKAVDGGLRLELRVQPGAGAERIEGVETLADGTAVMKVRLTAAPEGGKANAALIKLLSKRWKLPKSAFELVAGTTARRKSLLLHGAPEVLAARLEAEVAPSETGEAPQDRRGTPNGR